MDSLPNVTSNLSLGRILEAFEDQQTFLNVWPSENPLLYWILLIFKCILAGCGTKYLLHTKWTVAFLYGGLINACINGKSLFFIITSVIFGAANVIGLKYLNTDAPFPVILWLLFRVYDESEFYMDMYLVFCVLVLIFITYDEEYLKAITFLFVTACFSWIVENGNSYTTDNPHVIFAIQLLLVIALKPSVDVRLENDFMREICYCCVNLAIYLLLVFRYLRLVAEEDYFEELSDDIKETVMYLLFPLRLLITLKNEKSKSVNIVNPVSTVEEAIINTNWTSSSLPLRDM